MKKLVITLIAVIVGQSAIAQFGSLAFSVGVPRNQFRENTNAVGYGGDFTVGFPFQKEAPIYFGLDFNYQVYGLNRTSEDLEAEIRSNGAFIDYLSIPLEIVNTSSIFGTHAFFRAQAPLRIVEPYIEGLLGFRYISTSTKILDQSSDGRFSDGEDESNVIIRKTLLDDWIFSYGFGGGLMFPLAPGIFLDLRANFYKGERAKYFDGKDTEAWSVELANSSIIYDPNNIGKGDLQYDAEPRESTTDLLELKLGVAFQF